MVLKPLAWLGAFAGLIVNFIHLAVIYLGIVALVGVMAMFVLPAAKEQALLARNAVMGALVPEERILSHQDLLQILGMSESSQSSYVVARSGTSTAGLSGSDLSENGASDGQEGRKLRTPQVGGVGLVDSLTASSGFHIKDVPQDKALALREYLARKFRVARDVTGALIHVVYQEAEAKQLDPLLVLGVIAIESRYNPFAESSVGAQGLMQVMTRVHLEKFAPISSNEYIALNPIANIKVGTQILHDCIKRRGSVEAGLSCYVGATGPNDGGYAEKVQAERKRIALESRIPLGLNLKNYR